MLPDIAGTDGAQDRIGQRMQSGIGIGVAFERMVVGNLHAAQPDMIARRETMRVIAIAGSRLAEPRGQELFRHGEIPLGGDLDIGFLARNDNDVETGEFRQRHVVCDILPCVIAMGLENFVEAKSLRRLRAQQAVARNGDPFAVVAPAQRVGDRQQRNGCIRTLAQRRDHDVDDLRRNQGARRIVDQDVVRFVMRERFQTHASPNAAASVRPPAAARPLRPRIASP